ncbi:MAG: hypothetical protein R3A13_09190 [Bdellovibrionota bacterium]
MLDSDTGEVLALSQAPNVNFNSDKSFSKNQLKNLLIETVLNQAQLLKPICCFTWHLTTGVVEPTESIDCERGMFRVGRHTVKILSLRCCKCL